MSRFSMGEARAIVKAAHVIYCEGETDDQSDPIWNRLVQEAIEHYPELAKEFSWVPLPVERR